MSVVHGSWLDGESQGDGDPVIMKAKASKPKIVILGGTGLIGAKLVNLLRSRGHEVIPASPSLGINSITGEGLTEALTGAHVVPGPLPHL